MRSVIKISWLVAGVFVLTACDNRNNAEVQRNDPPAINNRKPQMQKLTINEDKLNAVYQQYQQLAAALVEGNVPEAKIAANAMEAGLREMPSTAHLTVSTSKIVSAKDVTAQRAAFAKLSRDMIALVKDAGVSNGEVHVGFCPMALNNEGASWLTNKKEIINPYFGDEMLTCGEIKETIN
jgi:hypothetical protein